MAANDLVTHSYFFTVSGETEHQPSALGWWSREIDAMRAMVGIAELHQFIPVASHDPYVNDGAGPLLMLEFGFSSSPALDEFVTNPDWVIGVTRVSGDPAISLTHDAFETRFFPTAGQQEQVPRTAPVSYVVRYYRPAENEVDFRAHYVTHHPPILGRLPGVRNVICYSPFACAPVPSVSSGDCMLGNEVVFDSVEALNDALASRVRDELRQDFHTFPKFWGANTHFAMHRERLR